MKDFINNGDGTMTFFESVDLEPVSNDEGTIEAYLEFQEAQKSGGKKKKLVKKIAAMHTGITRNKTEYPADELAASIPTWTTPYRRPIIKNHGRESGGLFGGLSYHVDDVIGLIDEAYIDKDMGVDTLMFKTSILDPEAQEKVLDGRYSTVSIGTKVKHAVCSVCNNDWATGECEHQRGKYYLTDEENPDSAVMCHWIMGGIEGNEISFVVAPSDSKAGVREHDTETFEESVDSDTENLHFSVDFTMEDVTTEDESALSMIEAELKLAPPSAEAGDESVSSEEEEDVVTVKEEKQIEDEVIDKEDEPTEPPIEGGESDEPVSDEDAAVDGPASEDEPGSEDGQENVEEPEGGEEEGPENEEENELLLENQKLRTAIHVLKAHLYIETGYHRGFLTGDKEALLVQFLSMKESTLDELLDKAAVMQEAKSVSEQVAGSVASPVQPTGDDAHANAERESVVKVKTDKGEHVVKLHGDSGGKTIKITPKL